MTDLTPPNLPPTAVEAEAVEPEAGAPEAVVASAEPAVPAAAPDLPGVSGFEPDDLAQIVADLGQPAFRVRQVADAVWRSPAASWDEVTTLARPLRTALAERLAFDTVAATEIRTADAGATEKALHRLADGALIESVLMHYPARGARRERNTLCISSQAGCAVGCPFCATGELGFGRDLGVAEIVDQVRHAQRRLAAVGRHLTNLVFMGMGEPLLNLDAVLGAIAVLTDPERFGLGARHVAISTSGVVPGMARLAALRPQWTLAVSLHAARDPLRDLLVPLNRRWPVAQVVAAAREYGRLTGRRVSFEYVLIDGINDTPADAAALVGLLRGSGAHVNCIPMNPVAHTPWQASDPERTAAFVERLAAAGIGVTVRRNRGQEAGAACGQLAAERGGEPPAPEIIRRRGLLAAASVAALAAAATVRPARARSAAGGARPTMNATRPRGGPAGPTRTASVGPGRRSPASPSSGRPSAPTSPPNSRPSPPPGRTSPLSGRPSTPTSRPRRSR
jgi:23S rRNA (adenine2503-C2)-methyltransferase